MDDPICGCLFMTILLAGFVLVMCTPTFDPSSAFAGTGTDDDDGMNDTANLQLCKDAMDWLD